MQLCAHLSPVNLAFALNLGLHRLLRPIQAFVDSVVALVPALGAVMLVKCIEVAADTFGGDGGHDAAG